jgi:predicted nucleic acid-binding protein
VVVADADVLVDALDRGRGPAVERIARLLQRGELAATAVTLYELTAGPSTTGGQLELLHVTLDAAVVLPVTRGAAEVAASANRYLARRGEAIAVADALIAGVCIAHGLPLLTGNRKHFARIPGLELVPLEDR